MAETSIQFHADPAEAMEFATRWAVKHDLTVIVEQFFPEYRAMRTDSPGAVNGDSSWRVDRLALCRTDADLTARSAHEFVTRNHDCLFFSVGAHDGEGLRESSLAGSTDDDETLEIWKRLVQGARAEMHSGAKVRNPHTDASAPAPKHLHTERAHYLADKGVKMLAAAGWNEFVFDDCSDGRPAEAS